MINRRNFLGAGVGLGLGLRRDGSVNKPIHSPRSDQDKYEQTLAETDRLELVGIPRSWAVVRQGFLPLSPERVVVMRPTNSRWLGDPGSPWKCTRADHVVRDRIAERISREERNWTAKVTPEKLSLIVRMTRYITDHYRMQACLEPWAESFTHRELLGPSEIPYCAAIPDWRQTTGARTQNGTVDWWVFLFPDGLASWSVFGLPVHIVAMPIFSRPTDAVMGIRIDVLATIQNTFMWATTHHGYAQLSRMDRITACRAINRYAAECLVNPAMERPPAQKNGSRNPESP